MLHDETGAPVVRATCYVCRELVPTIRCHYRARTYRRYDEHNGPDEKPCSASLSDVRRLRAREEPGPLFAPVEVAGEPVSASLLRDRGEKLVSRGTLGFGPDPEARP